MKRRWTILAAIAVVLLAGREAVPEAPPEFVPLPGSDPGDTLMQFEGIYYPASEAPFIQNWLKEKGIGGWHEGDCQGEPGKRSVVMLAGENQDDYIAVEMLFRLWSDVKTPRISSEVRARRHVTFRLSETEPSREEAEAAAKSRYPQGYIHEMTPCVQFTKDEWRLTWETKVQEGNHITPLRFSEQGLSAGAPRLLPPSLLSKAAGEYPPGTETFLLNHPGRFKAEAERWIKEARAKTVHEKAIAIVVQMRYGANKYRYREKWEVPDAGRFTIADMLTRTFSNRAGECDEWAAASVSYLRAAGIPARMVFLQWAEKDKPAKMRHAAAEYEADGKWWHLDALWYAIDDPGVYRRKKKKDGIKDVRYYEISGGDDRRSSLIYPSGLDDRDSGDGKLVWYDLFHKPEHPNGWIVAGYSYDPAKPSS